MLKVGIFGNIRTLYLFNDFLGDKHDVGHRLKDIWNAGRCMKDDFKRDQLTNSDCILNFKAGIQLFL